MKIDNSRIKKVLREKGVSVSELARRIGTDRSNIYHYLRGDYDPKIEKVEQIAEALGVSVSYLTGMSDDPDPTALRSLGMSCSGSSNPSTAPLLAI